MNIGEYLLIDSHCHPHFPPLGDSVETVLADMTAAGVQAALAVATSEQEAQEVLALCKKYPERFFAACGIHPLSDDDEKDDDEAVIKLCADEKVLAVGETGLDFFRAGDSKAAQRRRFAAHIAAARRLQKPLIIHTRDSIAAVLDMLRAENASEVGGVLHCYTGGTEGAKAALDINFIVSFTALSVSKNPMTCVRWQNLFPQTATWWKQTPPIWRPCRIAAKPTPPPMCAMSPKQRRPHAAYLCHKSPLRQRKPLIGCLRNPKKIT